MNRLFLLLAAVTMLACSSSNDLTRTKATELIDAKIWGGKPEHLVLVPTPDEMREGQTLGLWKEENVPVQMTRGLAAGITLGYQTKIVLTDYGKKFLTFDSQERLITVAQIRPAIEITGIADMPMSGGGVKEVEYTVDWWSQMPSEVKGIFMKRKSSRQRVIMRMYDDGWRIEKR